VPILYVLLKAGLKVLAFLKNKKPPKSYNFERFKTINRIEQRKIGRDGVIKSSEVM